MSRAHLWLDKEGSARGNQSRLEPETLGLSRGEEYLEAKPGVGSGPPFAVQQEIGSG